MKKSLALLLLLGIIPCRVAANEPSETFNLSTRTPVSGTNWRFKDTTYYDHNPSIGNERGNRTIPTLFVQNGANLAIIGTSNEAEDRAVRVVVSGTARITLNDANITRTGDAIRKNPSVPINQGLGDYEPVSPMMLLEGANLTLTLLGNNTLAMVEDRNINRWSAGLGVPHGASLTINGEGSLTARGGRNAAGIGSHEGTHAVPRLTGNITINSGTIMATGGEIGAGIGGGSLMQAGRITINGGNITAAIGGNIQPSLGAAGIGSGDGATATTNNNIITITGGTIRATGSSGAAGIGGGNNTRNAIGTISISGGLITATGGGGTWAGAGIGGGFGDNAGGNVNITGGTITARGGDERGTILPGIGGGSMNTANCAITINGNAVVDATLGGTPTLTRGIIFNDNTSAFHGTSITPTNNFTIQSGRTLTVPFGRTLTINEGITLTNNGTVINNGTVLNCGEITGWNGFWQGNPPDNCQPTSISGVRRVDNRFGIMFAENPVSESVEISVVLPASTASTGSATETNIVIYDMTGNVVWADKIANERRLSRWDLRNTAGRIVANGTYLVIAEVKDQNGRTHTYSARLGVKR